MSRSLHALLAVILALHAVTLGAQGGPKETGGHAPSLAAQETISLMQDFMLNADNSSLPPAERKSLESIKPGSDQFLELAKKFDKLYPSENCGSTSTCLSPKVLEKLRKTCSGEKKKGVKDQNIFLDLQVKTPAERRSALLGLQLMEDVSRGDPHARPNFPWCLFRGTC